MHIVDVVEPSMLILSFFFFNDTATTEIYTLSLHDALPICGAIHATNVACKLLDRHTARCTHYRGRKAYVPDCVRLTSRSEEHTSELQSRQYLVCRLLLEKKKKKIRNISLHPYIIPNIYCNL